MIRRFALLQTFVAVARAGKMKQAANELALTPGAVSQRIRQLEEVAGRRLFNRVPAGVELNAAGEAMFTALAEPFRAIEAVDRELGSPLSSSVTMSTTSSFETAECSTVREIRGFSPTWRSRAAGSRRSA